MSRLFQPLALGMAQLGHRVAMAPLTRYRMDDDWNATVLSKGTTANLKGNEVACLTDTVSRILRAKSMCPWHPHHQRGYSHLPKCRWLPQRTWYLVRFASRSLERGYGSSPRERLCHLLPALAPRASRSFKRPAIARIQTTLFQRCSHHPTRSKARSHDRGGDIASHC